METRMCNYLLVTLLLTFLCGTNLLLAKITRFVPPEGEMIEVWRLTHDPTIRDWANYHNTQCWSPDGRYVSFIHFTSDGVEFTREAAEIHIYDLYTDQDIKIDTGRDPRWANNFNWLFYVRNSNEDENHDQPNTVVMWYDADNKTLKQLTTGVNRLRETDADDRWLYGLTNIADGQRRAVRIALKENSQPEILPGDGHRQYSGKLTINPKHPIMVYRDHAYPDYYFSTENEEIPFTARFHIRADLKGNNKTGSHPLMEGAHFSWTGDGTYFLCGNGIMRGVRWDELLPGNIHFLAPIRCGDVGKCGHSGRWATGSTKSGRGPLALADFRSGDGWQVMKTHSVICYPGSNDNSGPYDIDAKGSPDATKIIFVSNYDLENGPYTEISRDVEGNKMYVSSTIGFPRKGRLVVVTGFEREVLSYEKKTTHSFEKLTRGLYGTPVSSPQKGQIVTSFEARLIPEEQWADLPLQNENMRRIIPDPDSPLLRQRSSDIYAAIVRYPDTPYLRKNAKKCELIPGENHWETYGYFLFMNGKPVNEKPYRPGEIIKINKAGKYTVVAVEWSGLQSRISLHLDIEADSQLRILTEKPADFSWTYATWLVDGNPVTEKQASLSKKAIREIVHRNDGIIHREWYIWGQITRRHDLNKDSFPTRQSFYQSGKLVRVELHHRDGHHVSTQYYDPDGNITESFHNALGSGRSYGYTHWWYDKTVPVKAVKGNTVYIKEGNGWKIAD